MTNKLFNIPKNMVKIGTTMASKILNVREPHTVFHNSSKFCNPEIAASFVPETYTITFNSDWCSKASDLEVLACTFHEMRHAYQFEQSKKMNIFNTNEPKARIQKWREERVNYNNPALSSLKTLNYLYQDIEIDAIAVAHLMMDKLFQAKTAIPPLIKSEVNERIIEIEMKLPILSNLSK